MREIFLLLLLGPSAPLRPVMFDYGLDAVGGTVMKDIPALVRVFRKAPFFEDCLARRRP
jgi:uncharacterized protein (DUF4213/DUF364 family)